MNKGFKYWFTNVFWYHYKAHLLTCVALVAVVTYFIYSMTNKREPDFMFSLISRNPVYNMQSDAIAGLFAEPVSSESETGFDTTGTALFLSEDNPEVMIVWQLLMVTMVDDSYALFIVGESALDAFADQLEGFVEMDELGIMPSDYDPRMAEIPSSSGILKELGLVSETFYAMIKRPREQGNGSVKTEDTIRMEKAAEGLARLIEVSH